MATSTDPGGGWAGCEEGDAIINGDFLGFVNSFGRNGIIIDGVVSFIELQIGSTPDDLWVQHALAGFTDEELATAKNVLWKASEKWIGDAQTVEENHRK